VSLSCVVPLERNGQRVSLQQRKFHVTIPFVYSTAGYGFLFNMAGAGTAEMGTAGTGGMIWQATASLGLSVWVTAPEGGHAAGPSPIYHRYADATGHAPLLREDAMLFWQSRNRYKSTAIALNVASKYQLLQLPVGVLVIDYNNEKIDGDFAPNPDCFPSLSVLSTQVRRKMNATTMFSFWPEAKRGSAEFAILQQHKCIINPDLGGYALDTTTSICRDLIWSQFLKPRYYDQGVSSYWLDETDGEGTGISNGDYGYDTSWGPADAYSNLWVGSYLSAFSDPVKAIGAESPLVLTRGAWAGGQKHGIVLWSSDIWSTFEELAAQVPQGVHSSLSGIPWWSTVNANVPTHCSIPCSTMVCPIVRCCPLTAAALSLPLLSQCCCHTRM
jgi:alpha-D-xyloside xylohydrolase